MKLTWKDCIKLVVSIFVLYLAVHYWQSAADLVSAMLGASLPLIIGAVVAYLVNILMSNYERRWPDGKGQKLRRPVCMLLAFLTLVAIVALVFGLIIPQLMDCIRLIIAELPGFMESTIALAEVSDKAPAQKPVSDDGVIVDRVWIKKSKIHNWLKEMESKDYVLTGQALASLFYLYE